MKERCPNRREFLAFSVSVLGELRFEFERTDARNLHSCSLLL